ncbi:MAG: hypothetical protein BGO98_12405 [Myxococcales bacterium 68-20]|nr:hypothetical protein [Myxococcales bacterium]OJY16969.1 MAG: hypothetical protein BGO98_12405 [Myxococcales bacterium 68-20]
MSPRRALFGWLVAVGVIAVPVHAHGADLILDNQTMTLGGSLSYGVVSITNGSKIIVPSYNGTPGTGNLVIRANSITIDASSSIVAKGSGYQGALCLDGAGPVSTPLAGGRGGCGVLDSGGGGAHRGAGGRGTKDCSPAGCMFPQDYEENCVGAVNAGACVSYNGCRDNDGLPSVAGLPYQHSPYAVEFGAAGGDKGCRDSDGFTPSTGTTVALAGGNGGGRIVLVAANAAQTGALTVNGTINANGNRGCASGNDSGGGGAGGSVLLVGDSVTIGSTARVTAAGGRGGDSQPKCLSCTTNADCGSGQTCQSGRCTPCNCTPCISNAQCNAALGQTCKSLGGSLGNVCADASNRCTPVPSTYEENECKGTQTSGTCDDCGGGGGGGLINVLSRVASVNPLATFDVRGAFGGLCPSCSGMAGGAPGELRIDGAYVGEVCDGFDNDFNGAVDDGLPPLNCGGNIVPSCINGVPQQCPANVPACVGPVNDTRPRFLVVIGTSGSMLLDPAGNPTFGDGSLGHVGVDTASDVDIIEGNNSKLFMAKSALNDVLAAFPDADFALARFHQDVSSNQSCNTASWCECQQACYSYDDPRNNMTPAHPAAPGCNMAALYPSAGYPPALNSNITIGWANQADCINYAGSCGSPRRGADVLVGFEKPRTQASMWIDGKETAFNSSTLAGDHCNFAGGGDCELRATGPTPLADSLLAAADYLKPTIQCDGNLPCRKYSVILLTDGAESCMGDPVAAATALKSAVPGVDVPVHVVGLGVRPSEVAQLHGVAAAGGTGTAVLTSDANGLSDALANIVMAVSPNRETCNGLDDNCNGLVDEAFPDKGQACDDGKLGVCKGTGVRVCNAAQDGTTCQIMTPGMAPGVEVCNGLDDDCDGVIDNDPSDGNQPCGVAIGACSQGVTACIDGALQCVGGSGPELEVCDGKDNDCNGTVDDVADKGAPCELGGVPGVLDCQIGAGLVCVVTTDADAGAGRPDGGAVLDGGAHADAGAIADSGASPPEDELTAPFVEGGGCACSLPGERSPEPRGALLCAVAIGVAVFRRRPRR